MYTLDDNVPKYIAISDILKKLILEGQYNPGDKLPSERILAEKFGVSLISVRGALKKLTGEGLIRNTEGRKGSFVKRPDRVLDPPRAGVIALYTDIASQRNPRFAPRIHGISKAAHFYGLRFEIIYPSTQNQSSICRDSNLNEFIKSGRIDGLIIDYRFEPTWEDYEYLKNCGVSFVLLGMYRTNDGCALTTWKWDNWFNKIVVHMIERKYRKIAVSLGPMNAPDDFHIATSQRIVASYRRLMREFFIPIRMEYLMKADWSVESGYAAGKKLLSLADPPQVILGADDYNAMGIIKAALDMGLSVPADVKIWGAGDFLHPSLLSSVVEDLEGESEDAVSALVQMIEGHIPDGYQERKKLVNRITTMDEDVEGIVPSWVEQFLHQNPMNEKVLTEMEEKVQPLTGV